MPVVQCLVDLQGVGDLDVEGDPFLDREIGGNGRGDDSLAIVVAFGATPTSALTRVGAAGWAGAGWAVCLAAGSGAAAGFFQSPPPQPATSAKIAPIAAAANLFLFRRKMFFFRDWLGFLRLVQVEPPTLHFPQK